MLTYSHILLFLMDENDAFSSSLIDTFRTTSAIFLTLSSEDRILGVCLLVLLWGFESHGAKPRVRILLNPNHSTTLPSSFLHWKWMNMFRSECKLAWTFIWNAIKLEKSGWFFKMYHYSYSMLPLHFCVPSGPDGRSAKIP